ncbi:hypothetical protein CsSME_00012297 [Camellia sinensis var. sinensis]
MYGRAWRRELSSFSHLIAVSLSLVFHRRSISAFSSQLCPQLHFESHPLVLHKINSAQLHFKSHSLVLRKIDSAQVLWSQAHLQLQPIMLML